MKKMIIYMNKQKKNKMNKKKRKTIRTIRRQRIIMRREMRR